MVKVILLTIIIVAVSILLLGIKIFFVKDGRFPKTHIGDNPDMKKRGMMKLITKRPKLIIIFRF